MEYSKQIKKALSMLPKEVRESFNKEKQFIPNFQNVNGSIEQVIVIGKNIYSIYDRPRYIAKHHKYCKKNPGYLEFLKKFIEKYQSMWGKIDEISNASQT